MALQPGERVELIQSIAGELSARREWLEIELILSEFGVPDVRSQGWHDNYDYAVERLRQGDERALIGLNAYLFSDPDEAEDVAEDGSDPTVVGPWRAGLFRLFISHTSENKAFANEVAKILRDRFGIDAFVAHAAIPAGRAWEQEIEVALATCEGMLALVTPDFIPSEYCDQEVGYVMGRGLPILAAMKGAKPHGFVSKWQGVPVGDGPSAVPQLAEAVFDALVHHDRSKHAIARSIVYRFVNSRNFDEAKRNTEHLLQIPRDLWTPEMVEEAERATVENPQVRERYWSIGTVPEAIKAHFDKMFDRDPTVTRPFAPSSAGDDDIPF